MTISTEALDVFRIHPDEFDLIITDQTMPRMSGIELADEIHRIRPEMPVILCTGFSQQVNAEKARAKGIQALLMKPLDIRETAITVRRVLDDIRKG